MSYSQFQVSFYQNNQLIYQDILKNENNNQNSYYFNLFDYNTILDLENQTLLRENEEYTFLLNISNKTANLLLKKENIDFDIEVNECFLDIKDSKITLEYLIETSDAKNKLIIEVKE